MTRALKLHPPQPFAVPAQVQFAKVDPSTGKLAPPNDAEAENEPFLPGTAPTTTALPPGHAHDKDIFMNADRPL